MKKLIFKSLTVLAITLLLCISCNKGGSKWGPDIYKPDTTFKIVGYISGWSFDRIDELEIEKLTYLNLAFANPDKEGNLLCDGGFDVRPVIEKGHNAGLKVFISLAGGGRPDTIIWKTQLLPENRTKFIGNILRYVEENNLDGVDVDIEGNLLPYVGVNYNPFVVELRDALHSKGKGITAALGATRFHHNVHQEALQAYDFINVMVYDKTGIWRPNIIGPHSPFSFAEEAIKYWTTDLKIPPEKITLGVPFYGFDFTPKARYINYSEIITQDISLAYVDSTGMRYYNGIPMIVKKVELAKKTLGGVMIWEISTDATGDLSLLRALYQTVKAGNCPVTTFFRDEDGDGFGSMAKPFQACTAPDGFVDNMDDKDDTDASRH
ncbi:MAG TPA: glycosyl hydrolase family 18 protein [Bacteroidales bacterium]|nr:glycosyl hydrolase family 18 protein [Bacteroidales bacterium]